MKKIVFVIVAIQVFFHKFSVLSSEAEEVSMMAKMLESAATSVGPSVVSGVIGAISNLGVNAAQKSIDAHSKPSPAPAAAGTPVAATQASPSSHNPGSNQNNLHHTSSSQSFNHSSVHSSGKK